jgi:predicted metal-binding membrane protein
MDGHAARAIRVGAAGYGLLLAALLSWVAVGRGAADLDGAGPVAFAGAWTVMMSAMMLPSLVPAGRAVAGFAGPGHALWGRSPVTPLAAGYLLVWAIFGLAAGGLIAGCQAAGVDLGGRGVTVVVLLAAALYELTPAKSACLRRCRHPLGLVVTHWRPGVLGNTRLGAFFGAWCTGCCWVLMAGLLALGAMSMGWMLLVAALVATEKLLPWERAATGAVVAALVALAVVEAAS